MKLKTIVLLLFSACVGLQASCQTKKYKKMKQKVVQIETSEGNIVVKLYDETPLHRDNFLRLIGENAYNGVIFHRVIKDFMIQTGDINSKNPVDGKQYGASTDKTTLPAEFNAALYHKKGALAAARRGDQVNPERRSSDMQFYIVQGKKVTEAELNQLEQHIAQQTQQPFKYSKEQRKVYAEQGGTPFLDMQYTVFGEVLEGMDIVDKIAGTPTNPGDRPQKNIFVNKITILN
jgi:peptidyl-prolyl cis-trans isomerase B (cyclophilin B)